MYNYTRYFTMKITQGFAFRYKVKNDKSQLIFINPISKHVVTDIIEEDGQYFLFASADETKSWEARTLFIPING